MADNIEKILEELYLIDSSLRDHESQLRKLVHTLLAAEPDTKFDRAFAERLKKELLGSAHGFEYPLFSAFPMRFAFGGVVALLIIVPVALYVLSGDRSPGGIVAIVDDVSVTDVGRNAFGSLRLSAGQGDKGAGVESSTGAPAALDERVMAPGSMAMGMSMSGGGSAGASMIAPDYIGAYTFRYVGDDFSLNEKSGMVLRRKKGLGAFGGFADLVKKAGISLDVGAFSRFNIRSLDVVEERDKGYAISVNFEEGMLSINPNWPYWEAVPREYKPLTRQDVPSDSVIIGIASEFLKRYGVDTSRYGSPEIMDVYPYALMDQGAERLSATTIAYMPDTMSVTYPIMIGGQKIYESGGGVYGLVVNVSVRDRIVHSVYNLTSHVYDSSEYPLETNKDTIIKIASRGGVYGYPGSKGAREVSLGTPTRVLLRHWQYQDGVSSELYVPALAFPVVHVPDGIYVYAKVVVVPLVKDLIEEPPIVTPVEPLPLPMPMPMPMPDVPITDSYPTPVNIARKDLASQQGVSVDDVLVESVEKVEWSDSCFGAGGPEEACLTVITPGYRVILTLGEKKYVYHTDLGSNVRFVK